MKAMIILVLIASACVDAGDPEVGARQQDERIEVNGCSPGFLELGEGDNLTCIGDRSWSGGVAAQILPVREGRPAGAVEAVVEVDQARSPTGSNAGPRWASRDA